MSKLLLLGIKLACKALFPLSLASTIHAEKDTYKKLILNPVIRAYRKKKRKKKLTK